MRVKIGDTWYEATPDAPIMIELNIRDKLNLANMAPTATKYAVFETGGAYDTSDAKLDWMEAVTKIQITETAR